MSSKLKKRLLITITPLLLIAITLFSFVIPQQSELPGTNYIPRVEEDTVSVVRVLTTGDAMAHGPQTKAALSAKDGTYSYNGVLEYLSPVIKQYDLSIVNFETTMAGKPYKGYPQFSAPDAYAEDLRDAGFNFFVQANNHAVDRHNTGVIRTIEVLEKQNIRHTGTFRDKAERDTTYPVLLDINDIKISLLNITFSTNGINPKAPVSVNMINKEEIKADLVKARAQNPDLIMVVVHWGDEYKRYPNIYQKNIADFLVGEGVDIIVGHHPHVLQPVEWKKSNWNGQEKNVLVIWSLGNFYSNQRARYKNGGMFVNFDIVKSKNDGSIRIETLEYYPFWVWKNKTPLSYKILPCEMMDSLVSKHKLNATDKALFNTFTNDTRSHLSKNGVVTEHFYYIK